jgi:hypothetical protein
MANFAVVNPLGGIVSNVVVGEDLATVEAVVGSVVEIKEETGTASIGWIWDGTSFTNPGVVEDALEEPTA